MRDGDGWVVNGGKTFIISNGINADLVVTAVRTGEHPHQGLSMMVIERGFEGFERGAQIEKVGQHRTTTPSCSSTTARCPARTSSARGHRFGQLMAHLVPERLSLAAVSTPPRPSSASGSRLDYVKERTAFGRPIGKFQNTRFMIADMLTRTEQTRMFVDRTIQRHVDGTATVQEAAMAKYASTELFSDVADQCLQLHGGYATPPSTRSASTGPMRA